MVYCLGIEYKLITEGNSRDALIEQGYTMDFGKSMGKRRTVPRYSAELSPKEMKLLNTEKLQHPCRDDIPYTMEHYEVKRRIFDQRFEESERPVIKRCMKKTKKGEVPSEAWTEVYNFDKETIVKRFYLT